MDKELKDQVVKKLSEKDHILQRSGMYLGSSTTEIKDEYILIKEDNIRKFKQVKLSYVPGLIKIMNELIDNSIDEYVRTNGTFATKIDITLDNSTFSIRDNGRGIPVTEVEDEHKNVLYQPELAWCHARAGSNFDDEVSTTIGTYGVGSMISSVFSTEFTGVSNDGKLKCTVNCKDNNNTIKTTTAKAAGQRGVAVTIKPDLKRFGLDKIDESHIKMIERRLYYLSVSYPQITFKMNGEKIRVKGKDFFKMFGNEDEITIEENENFLIAIMPSVNDEFQHFSLMNGLNLDGGGSHIEYISNSITYQVREKLLKKHKTIKPADVKRKLFVLTIMKNFAAPKYDSQTKERLTNSTKEITDYFTDLDMDRLVKKVQYNKTIISSITDYFKIAEAFKKQQELKAMDKKTTKKPKDDNLIPPIGQWNRLFLSEGLSANDSIASILGREGNGFYAMMGLPVNAYSAPIETIIKSDKLKALQAIIGLKYGAEHQQDINFNEIILATDQDLAGYNIRALLIGTFYRFARNLIEDGKIKILNTPLFVCTKKSDRSEKLQDWFYSFEEQRAHEKKHGDKFIYAYKKGLSSWDAKGELDVVIEKAGLEPMLQILTIEDAEKDAETIDNWLSGLNADIRKEMLEGYEFSINAM